MLQMCNNYSPKLINIFTHYQLSPATYFSRGFKSHGGTSLALGKTSLARGLTTGVPGEERGRAAAADSAASCC